MILKRTMQQLPNVFALLVVASVCFTGFTLKAGNQPIGEPTTCYTKQDWIKNARSAPFPAMELHQWFTEPAMELLAKKGLTTLIPNPKATIMVFILPEATGVFFIFGADECQLGEAISVDNTTLLELDALARIKKPRDADGS